MSEHIHDREFQMAILRKTKAHGWTAEDWMFFWIVVAGIGWIGFVAMALLLNSLLNDLKHERGIKTSERPGGDGAVSLRVRGDVAADDAALRGDSVQVPSAGVVVATEEKRAAGGVSASGHEPGHFAGVGECGLNLMQGTRVVAETHNLVFAGATPAPAPTLNLAGRSVSSGDPFCPTSLAFRPAILPEAQCSSGTIQSRPFPARTVKVMESAGQLTQRASLPEGEPEREGDWQADMGSASGFAFPTAGSRAGGRDAECTGAVVDGSMAAPILNSEQKTAKGAKGA